MALDDVVGRAADAVGPRRARLVFAMIILANEFCSSEFRRFWPWVRVR